MAGDYPDVPILTAALRCRCPRCGQGGLFDGLLAVRKTCPVCALDLSGEDAGDGAAVFVILILGAIIVGLAVWVEVRFDPPIWVHAVLWLPLTFGGAIAMLRPLKAAFIAQQYRVRALGDTRP